MKLWIASISAIALAASPALAQGNSQGNANGSDKRNNGNGGGPPAASSNPGNGNANGNGNSSNRGDRGGAQAQERGNSDVSPQKRGNGNRNGNSNNSNRPGPPITSQGANRGNSANDNRGASPVARSNRDSEGSRGNDSPAIRYEDGPNIDFRRVSTGIADGCPPGLARKYNGCRPPGQARKQDSFRYARYSPDWWGLGDLVSDRRGSYYYDDGFLMRIGGGGEISGYIPLLGGALSIGNQWPGDYRYSQMPSYYEDYYGLGGRDSYRYADNVVYRTDPETRAITAIAALLTGNEFTVGQQMPQGYDIYNVPYGYRNRYYDSPQAMYRYNDGHVYEIDPETMLVSSAIELLL